MINETIAFVNGSGSGENLKLQIQNLRQDMYVEWREWYVDYCCYWIKNRFNVADIKSWLVAIQFNISRLESLLRSPLPEFRDSLTAALYPIAVHSICPKVQSLFIAHLTCTSPDFSDFVYIVCQLVQLGYITAFQGLFMDSLQSHLTKMLTSIQDDDQILDPVLTYLQSHIYPFLEATFDDFKSWKYRLEHFVYGSIINMLYMRVI
jgi:hypothetical protein